ncbi:MAG: geranylgeranylglyceryl/heptaprenylglyceryl phosphate synthase [Paludibacter sp.]|nr:geranylgeranylglyceryl/heptaprenylglyceryl phosphate synthase [Paludibacter sp.]MDD4198123.1 geranylgeranylglyceryl/heptaprenylglyceryl phosphate synthase [Paludibacter sp.]MDD4427381.1 geranylgeranylglyceryl/heptaprenylglyceryl phosphate synthase [Paludibacter sp.]
MRHNNIYRKILLNREMGKKMFAVLIDPEKSNGRHFASIIAALKISPPDFVFVGGSHAVKSLNNMIEVLKEEVDTTVILFPGDASQFSEHADALLFLSLLSGRNPEYLIGQHIKSAVAIKESEVEVIPTAYLLIDGGKVSSVEFISNTRAIPRDKREIVRSTAVAGELLGMRLTYLEAGSGASQPVPGELISYIRKSISSPLIVGGGITTTEEVKTAFEAGADLVVVGNIFETELHQMTEFIKWVDSYNSRNETGSKDIPLHPDIISL